MTQSQVHELAHESHCRDHIVQFYKDHRYLTGSLAEFARQGLARDEAVVVLCTPEHWKALKEDLSINAHQIRYINAHEALEKVLDAKGNPSLEQFNALVGGAYREARLKSPRVRFFGELVDILCSTGRNDEAHVLEGYWNRFLSSHVDCFLLCGYSTQHVAGSDHQDSIQKTHSDTIPVEDVETLVSYDLLYRKIGFLELNIAVEKMIHKDQNQHQQKLSILGEMSAGMAHELNNPLSVASYLIEDLKRLPSSQGEPAESKIAKIEKSIDRVNKIVKNVLRLARQEKIQLSSVSIQPCIQNAIELNRQSLYDNNISIRMNVVSAELYCLGDECMLTQIFSNLISNARDALVSANQPHNYIEISARQASDQKIEVVIEDNGTGMDEKTRQSIFSPFFTTKGSQKGTGLGLSISNAALKEMGGQISCFSALGVGTRFTISLTSSENPELT